MLDYALRFELFDRLGAVLLLADLCVSADPAIVLAVLAFLGAFLSLDAATALAERIAGFLATSSGLVRSFDRCSILSRAALAKNAERVRPRRAASASIALNKPTSIDRFALVMRPSSNI